MGESSYPDFGKSPAEIDAIYKECAKLKDDAASLSKDLDKVQKGPPGEISKPLVDIGNGLVEMATSILSFAEKIGGVADKLLKVGKELQDKKLLYKSLEPRLEIQGKRFENLGPQLHVVGDKFAALGRNLGDIARRTKEEYEKPLVELEANLKDVAGQVKDHEIKLRNSGTEIQKLKANALELDVEKANEKDLGQMSRALEAVIKDLEQMMQVKILFLTHHHFKLYCEHGLISVFFPNDMHQLVTIKYNV